MQTFSRPRVIFIDIDGTIVGPANVIHPQTIEAIQSARSRGHRVYLCTGRSVGDILPTVAAIGFDGAITNGGARIDHDGGTLEDALMTAQDLDRLTAFFDEHGMHYFLQGSEEVFASDGIAEKLQGPQHNLASAHERTREHLRTTRPDLIDAIERASHPADRSAFRRASEAPRDQIAKAVFLSERAEAVSLARTQLHEQFHVVPGSMPFASGSNGEISPAGVHKGAAIRTLLEHLGVDPADAVGIGDSWNDAEMFEICGTSVAMGNADPALQARADFVTSGVLDGGVAQALERLGLT